MNRLSDIDAVDIEQSDSIDAQAAGWFARNRSEAGRADRKAFAVWQATPAHARAYAEFEQLWADLAQLQQLNKPVALPGAGRQRPRLALGQRHRFVQLLQLGEVGPQLFELGIGG